MKERIFAGIATAGFCLLVAGTGQAATARQLQRSVIDESPATAALFHPDNPTSLTVLDSMRDAGNHEVLAVCVGAGCTGERVQQTALERKWSFDLAYDASGDTAIELLGSATVPNVVRIPEAALSPAALPARPRAPAAQGAAAAPSASSGLMSSLGLFGGGSGQSPVSAAMSSPPDKAGPSILQLVLLTVPVGLLGLGLGVFYLGSRRREHDHAHEKDEDALLAEHIHARHGRKSPRRATSS